MKAQILLLLLAFSTIRASVIICTGRIQFDKANVEVQNIKVESTSITGVKKYEVILQDDASYSIPVDSVKQSIILRPVSSGFLFQPKEYKLTKTELEACGEHSYDFQLAGFQVQSKVMSAKSNKPVPAVKVALIDIDTKKQLQAAHSDSEGVFGFDKVKPGKYLIEVEASGIVWKENRVECHVAGPTGSKECTDTVLFAVGYEVRGSVVAKGEGLKNIKLTIKPKQECLQFRQEGREFDVTTDSQGRFVFDKLPEGDYLLTPSKGPLNMEFKPKQATLSVSTETNQLEKPFELQSYDIKGVVETKLNNPYTVALIEGNERSEVKVGKDGKFVIKGAKLGLKYSVETECEDYEFEPTPLLVGHPDRSKPLILKASKFNLCGEIQHASQVERKLVISSKGERTVIVSSKDGKFCSNVVAGEYSLTPELTEDDRKNGFLIVPAKRQVKVVDKPVKGVNFEQKKIVLKGKVGSLSSEEEKRVEIVLFDSKKKELSKKKLEKGGFQFNEVTTGKYSIQVRGDEFCFNKRELEVTITAEQADNQLKEHFKKTGYSLKYESSHTIEKAVLNLKNAEAQTLTFQKGKNRVCVASPGEYKIEMPRCYEFQEKELVYDTAKRDLLRISPVRFGVQGVIRIQNVKSAIPLNEIVNMKVNNQKNLELTKTQRQNEWAYFYMGDPKEVLKIKIAQKPNLSSDLLFIYRQFLIEPDNLEVSVNSNCHSELDFVIKMGTIVKGEVNPRIPGVEISMLDLKTTEVLQSTMTDSEGRYELAPMDASVKFKLDAKKDGYQLMEIKTSDKDQNRKDFILKKLSLLIVTIQEKESQKPVSNVIHLLSNVPPNSAVEIAPGKYRFTNIKQGKQTLQVMLREYEFENNGVKQIEIEEGQQHEVNILAFRVSFSAYGRVTELSTKPVKNVLVLARCVNEVCQEEIHESVTNSEGQFRIEELKPKGVYEIEVAKGKLSQNEQDYGQKLESKIHATVPKKIKVEMKNEDKTGIQFMVKLYSPLAEVQGRVVLQDEDLSDFRHILKQPRFTIEVFQLNEPGRAATQEIRLTISRIFKISGLHRNKKYQFVITSDSKKYSTRQFTFVADEEAERNFQEILVINAAKQTEGVEEGEASPIVGLSILAALVGGFVYFKKKN